MVFSHVSKNFSNAVKSRPPLVVFSICILGIIVTTLSLAYYVHTQDKIFNVDARDDWLSLLQHLNTYDICTESTNGPIFKTNKKGHINTQMVSIISFAKLSKLSSNQAVNVQGLVPLEGWSTKCPDKSEIPSHLQIEFTIPPPDQNSTKEENICVTLSGPADFMPKLIEQASCGPKQNIKKWARLTTQSNKIQQGSFCTGGSLAKLQYDIDCNKNLKFDMFLSQEDRLIINSHLIVTSCFLVFIVILITCYALIRSRTTNNAGSDSKQHLMAKGMYL